MFQWLKNLLWGPSTHARMTTVPVEPHRLMEETIRRCYETGNIVMGSIDDDGNVTIQEFKPGEEDATETNYYAHQGERDDGSRS